MSEKAYATLQIRLSEEEKAMIKNDAKALGMTPGRYIAMICGLVNESAREMAAGEFVERMCKSVMKGLENTNVSK